MQVSQRQLTLQKIIKNQEAHIAQLEKSLTLTPQLHKERQLESIILDLRERLAEKDREYAIAQAELASLKGNLRESRQEHKAYHELQKEKEMFERDVGILEREKVILLGKVSELDGRLQLTTNAYEKELDKMVKINQALSKQGAFFKENLMSIELEIEKMQIFYRSSIQEMPKRKETLTWVGNLIKFIDKYEDLLHHNPLEKEAVHLQKSIQNLGEIFSSCGEEMKGVLSDRFQEMRRLKEEVCMTINQSNKRYSEILEENKVFWEEIKKEKSSKINDSERRMDEQNRKIKEEYECRYNQLLREFKGVEQEKREIVLAIQQLKNYYESRERNYKDEINLLKSGELRLIECSERREVIFEEQILKLTEEVTYLGRIYEDSMRSNIANQRNLQQSELRKDVQPPTSHNFKEEIKEVLSLLRKEETHLENELSNLSERQLRALQHVKSACDVLIHVQNEITRGLEVALDPQGDGQGGGKQEDSSVDMVRFEELEERKNYEISILKKKNQRFQETLCRLQDKTKAQHNTGEEAQSVKSLVERIQQLEDQCALLFEHNQKYKSHFSKSIQKLSRVNPTHASPDLHQYLRSVSGEIQKIQSLLYEDILPLIKQQTVRQEEYVDRIQNSMRRVTDLLEHPLQHGNPLIRRHDTSTVDRFSASPRVIEINVNFSKEIKEYREILEEKNSIASNAKINKTLTELVSSIKATLPQREHNRSTLKDTENTQVERKSVKGKSALEHRVREIQTARISDRNEVNKYLEKVEQTLKKVDLGKHTLTKSTELLGRMDSTLHKVLREVSEVLNRPSSEKHSRQLTAISKKAIEDLEIKLKESVCQNQGLIKQMKLVTLHHTLKDKID